MTEYQITKSSRYGYGDYHDEANRNSDYDLFPAADIHAKFRARRSHDENMWLVSPYDMLFQRWRSAYLSIRIFAEAFRILWHQDAGSAHSCRNRVVQMHQDNRKQP